MRVFLLLVTVTLNIFAAGPIIFGARGGAPFTDATNSITRGLSAFSATQRYAVGPTVGVRLPFGFSVEGDALFNRQTFNFGQFAGFTAASTHSDSWQFPVMLKFTPGHQVIAPVVGAGVVVRHLNDFGQAPSFLLGASPFANSSNTVGFVGGVGVRFRVGPVDVTPEVRYTRWGGNSFSQSFLNLLPLNRNEASVLVGVTF